MTISVAHVKHRKTSVLLVSAYLTEKNKVVLFFLAAKISIAHCLRGAKPNVNEHPKTKTRSLTVNGWSENRVTTRYCLDYDFGNCGA